MATKFRPWQVSLRVSLIAVTCCCIWLGLQVRRATQQTKFVRLVEDAGGRVAYRHQVTRNKDGAFVTDGSQEPKVPRWIRNLIGEMYFQQVDLVHLNETDITDDWLENMKLVPRVRLLSLRKTAITGKALRHLAGLSSLEVLDLWHCEHAKLEQKDLAYIGGLRQLTSLDMTGCDVANDALSKISHLRNLSTLSLIGSTRIRDDGLRNLRGLTEMTYLWLNGTDVGDKGMEHLSDMKNLVWLDLSQTNVTDGGLDHLVDMHNLTELGHDQTQVTESAVNKLRGKMSNLQ